MSAVSFDSGGVRCAGVHLPRRGRCVRRRGRAPPLRRARARLRRHRRLGAAALRRALRRGRARRARVRLPPLRRERRRAAPAALDRRASSRTTRRRSPSRARCDGVDPERIVVWGSSYSGGHVVPVAVADGRVAAVISQVPGMDGAGDAAQRSRATRASASSRGSCSPALRDLAGSLRGRPPVMVPVVGPPGSVGAMTTPDAEPGYLAIAGPDLAQRGRRRGSRSEPAHTAPACRPIASPARSSCRSPTATRSPRSRRPRTPPGGRPAAPRCARTRSGTSTSTPARRSSARSPTSCTSSPGTSARARRRRARARSRRRLARPRRPRPRSRSACR